MYQIIIEYLQIQQIIAASKLISTEIQNVKVKNKNYIFFNMFRSLLDKSIFFVPYCIYLFADTSVCLKNYIFNVSGMILLKTSKTQTIHFFQLVFFFKVSDCQHSMLLERFITNFENFFLYFTFFNQSLHDTTI